MCGYSREAKSTGISTYFCLEPRNDGDDAALTHVGDKYT